MIAIMEKPQPEYVQIKKSDYTKANAALIKVTEQAAQIKALREVAAKLVYEMENELDDHNIIPFSSTVEALDMYNALIQKLDEAKE